MKVYPSKIVKNFLSDEDISVLRNELANKPEFKPSTFTDVDTALLPKGVIPKGTVSRTILQLDRHMMPKFRTLLDAKLKQTFGDAVNINHVHMLTSYIPYRIHTDALHGEHGIEGDNVGAYTFLIPLDDYDTHTIVFNEYQDNDKLLNHYVEANTPKNVIDDETYEKYFSCEFREYVNYLSIDKIFKWEKGACLAMSRYVFHGSDNYFGRIPFKQGLVCWTSASKDFEPIV